MVDVLGVKGLARADLLANLQTGFGPLSPGTNAFLAPLPTTNVTLLKRLLALCPCLATQLSPHKDVPMTSRATVHLCELTLGGRINSANAHNAFLVQQPKKGPPFKYEPLKQCGDGGGVMEMLCSEVLVSAGVARMEPAQDGPGAGWPAWEMPGHILLNEGKMRAHKAFGDILVPCAPTNVVVSVKNEKARERLLYSSNAIEGVGYGFFDEPQEFWSPSRMALYKRMGFSAIYMPVATLHSVMTEVASKGHDHHAVNINGRTSTGTSQISGQTWPGSPAGARSICRHFLRLTAGPPKRLLPRLVVAGL